MPLGLKLCVFLTLTVIFGASISSVNSTLSPKSKGDKSRNVVKPEKVELVLKTGALEENIFERGLIDDEPSAKDIIVENGAYYKDTAINYFNGSVLGYVTPWNNKGYDVAKTWGPKFDIISPVWLQILRKGPKQYEVAGLHDIDAGWIKDVKKAGRKTKIYPRILFDHFTDKDFSQMLTYKEEMDTVTKLIYDTVRQYKFDGIVLEVWSQLSARVDDQHLLNLIRETSIILKSSKFGLVLVIPPTRKETVDLFTPKHFEELFSYVDYFSLMTYDYSSFERPGPAAPLYWVQNAVEHICPSHVLKLKQKRAKILLGLNFFGNDFTPEGGKSIIHHEYLSLLSHVKGRLQLDDRDKENFFEIKTSTGRHVVFYPTIYSINERINLARELFTGISIWEIGQGLDYFYDLL